MLLVVLSLAAASQARAGCGCTKPPPPPAAVRPAFAWPGAAVTVFDARFVAGKSYRVLFHPLDGLAQSATGTAVARRDLADGVVKPQLVVALPELPLGPATIQVKDAETQAVVRIISDREFTVAPHPVGVPNGVGVYRFERYRAAVSRDGTVLMSLDFEDIKHARVFEARALEVPLRFGNEDLAFYNVQGFLMQLLGDKMPGLYAIGAAGGEQSDLLRYSRHEFNTYFLQHDERSSHAVDPTDANWHLDGTPHIDHDHQILAIDARLPNGALLAPGATEAFTLEIRTETLFSHGVVGESALAVDDEARVQSYQLGVGGAVVTGSQGHVVSNGQVAVTADAQIRGDARAASIYLADGGQITGQQLPLGEPIELLPVDVPAGLVNLREKIVEGPWMLGVGSYRIERLEVREGGIVFIDNADGPVTIYVTDRIRLDHGGVILTASPDPEKLAIYLADGVEARFSDGAGFHGVVYGPGAQVKLDHGGVFRGALVGGDVELTSGAQLLYYEALHRNDCSVTPAELPVDADIELVPGETLELPLGTIVDALAGWKMQVDQRLVPIGVVDGLLDLVVGVVVPPDLKPGSRVELTMVDAKGCRSRRTVMAVVAQPAPACGLFGIEVALVPMIAAVLRRRSRR